MAQAKAPLTPTEQKYFDCVLSDSSSLQQRYDAFARQIGARLGVNAHALIDAVRVLGYERLVEMEQTSLRARVGIHLQGILVLP